MKNDLILLRSAVGAALVCFQALASADVLMGYEVYSGTDANASGDGSQVGQVNPDAAPYQQRQAFQSRLVADTVRTEGFESFSRAGRSALDLGASVGAQLQVQQIGGTPPTEVGYIENLTTPYLGRFNTTDAADAKNWWQSQDSFTLTFTSGISAFGFYGTDFGDFDGVFTLDLLNANGVAKTLTVRDGNVMSGPAATSNGWLQFYGFVDTVNSYTGLRFNIGQVGNDRGQWDLLGFDDFIVGQVSPGGNVPEPASLALVGVSLLALAVSRRRRG